MVILENQSLLPYNTFRIDVQARYFADISNREDLKELAGSSWVRSMLLIGGGSNILLTKNYDGLVAMVNLRGIEKTREDADHVWIKAMAGEVWHRLVMFCVEHGYGGIENLSLIPGCVGAAPIQNIGAYGVELSETFENLTAVDLATGKEEVFDRQGCRFGYRDSVFKRELKGRFCITSVLLRLTREHTFHTSYGAIQETLGGMGVKELSLRAVSDAVIAIRRKRLPDPAVTGNAGSFFKNPVVAAGAANDLTENHPGMPVYPSGEGTVKLSAGWLIEQCGWRGRRMGNAGSPQQHALTLVNYGGATGAEIRDLAMAIREDVHRKFGILLEPEVNIL